MTDTTDKVAFAAAELNAASEAIAEAIADAAAEVDALRGELARQTGIAVDHCARADAAERMVAELRAIISSRRPDPDSGLSADAAVDVLDDIAHALASTEAVAGRWVSKADFDGLLKQSAALLKQSAAECMRIAAERDAAIAARDEAVAAFERSGANGLVAMAQRDAAERARDEVGIQLAAAQAEIARLIKGLRDVEGFMLREWRPPAEAVLAMVRDVAAGGPSVPGDALAPRITAALEASGIDASNVKGVE